jgi:CAAX prenyl protease-like protein
VFIVWIGPDLLFDYRGSWLFQNALTGSAESSIPPHLRQSALFAVLRSLSCIVAVPLAEELFWRGWLIRWLVDRNFLKVPYTAYVPSAFWIVVLLFGSEHGAYWEVGLIAGAIYNWWLIRTGNLADCVVAHAVTNGLLSVYVLATGQWQYWL